MLSHLKPRVDRMGWILFSSGIFFILLGLGYTFYTFPKGSPLASVFLAVGALIAIILGLYQFRRQNQMQQKQNTKST